VIDLAQEGIDDCCLMNDIRDDCWLDLHVAIA
jgi:hypothetical protein